LLNIIIQSSRCTANNSWRRKTTKTQSSASM